MFTDQQEKAGTRIFEYLQWLDSVDVLLGLKIPRTYMSKVVRLKPFLSVFSRYDLASRQSTLSIVVYCYAINARMYAGKTMDMREE